MNTGTLIFFKPKTKLTSWLNNLQNKLDKPYLKCDYFHVGMIYVIDSYQFFVEMTSDGYKLSLLSDRLMHEDLNDICIKELKIPLLDLTEEKVINRIFLINKKKYDYINIFQIALNVIFKKKLFNKNSDRRYICSELIAKLLKERRIPEMISVHELYHNKNWEDL